MPVGRIGRCCSREGCSKPARELGGLCTPCWMGLTPTERWSLQTDAEVQLDRLARTDPIDSRAVAECCALEDLWEAPAYGEAA